MGFLSDNLRRTLLLAGLGLSVASPAQAAMSAIARHHYLAGTNLYKLGRFDAAAREFTTAYQNYPSSRLLYNLAQAERKQGQLADALRHYEQFLWNESALTPATRGAVHGYMSRIKVAMGQGSKTVAPPPKAMPELLDPALGPEPKPGAGGALGAPAAPAQPAVAQSASPPPSPVAAPPPATPPPPVEAAPGPRTSYALVPLVAEAKPAPPPPPPAPVAAPPPPPPLPVQAPVAAAPHRQLSGSGSINGSASAHWELTLVKPSFSLRRVMVQPDATFAVGDSGIFFVAINTGAAGQSAFRPVRAGVENWLGSVWGTGTELFMAGDSGTLLRRFGGRLKPVPSGTTRSLFAMGGTASDWFAVGDGGTAVRWNGTTFAPVSTGTSSPLFSVYSIDGETVAVGASGTILRFSGDSFVPMTSGTTSWLHGVWGSARNDLFAVGAHGTILHFDGRSWQPQPSGTTQTLLAVWGSSRDDVYAVGSGGTILRYDGGSWRPMASGTRANLFSVSGSNTDIYAVGDAGTILHLQPR